MGPPRLFRESAIGATKGTRIVARDAARRDMRSERIGPATRWETERAGGLPTWIGSTATIVG